MHLDRALLELGVDVGVMAMETIGQDVPLATILSEHHHARESRPVLEILGVERDGVLVQLLANLGRGTGEDVIHRQIHFQGLRFL